MCCTSKGTPRTRAATASLAGMMMQNVLPDGSWLDSSHMALYVEVSTNGIGRFVGPWLARLIIEWGDQDMYALQQMVFSVGFLALFELLVVRPYIAQRVCCCGGGAAGDLASEKQL